MTEEETFITLKYKRHSSTAIVKDDFIIEPDVIYWVDDNEEFHSYNDEPAIISANKTQYWFKHGKIHRDKGPALIYHNGIKFWFRNGIISYEHN